MQRIFDRPLWILLTLLLFTLVMQGCAGVRPEVDLSKLSGEDEIAFGNAVNSFVLQRLGSLCPDESVQSYLRRVGTALQTDASDAYDFVVANDPAPAYLSLPGGQIVLTRGLLYQLENETELVTLLAHLLGHAQARHGLQIALSRPAVNAAIAPFKVPNPYDGAAVSLRLVREPFSEAEEIVADRNAARILADAGYDPLLLVTLLPEIEARLAAIPDVNSGNKLHLHPVSSARIDAGRDSIKLLVRSRSRPIAADPAGFAAMRAVLEETRPAYELYQKAVQTEKQGLTDQSIELYLQAATSAPDEVLLLTGLGLAYMRQEVLVAARQHLNRATRVDNRYYLPQLGLGYIFLQQGDFTKASRRLRRSQMLLPTAQGGYFFALVFDETKNFKSALSAYADVVRHFKESREGILADKRISELEALDGLD